MKSYLLFIYFLASNYIFAQNSVGIGTTSPIATLEVVRGTAPLGTAAFHGTINTSHFNIGITEDTYINGGKAGSHVVLNYAGSGLVGIGTLTPFSPLTFNNNLGEKISLYGNSGNNYGFGIAVGTLQIHSDAVGADIAFGYGSGISFTERMRIMGNGNVGIGISNPQHPLDINGRMRLSGTNPNDPGIWLNDAGIDRAFIGLQNNNHVGFYGANSGIAWGFTMNTNSGALALNGNEGQPGQVLVSNGGSAAAGYTTIGNVINSSFKVINDYSIVYVNSPGVDLLLPQLSHTITLTRKSRLIISANISIFSNECVGCSGANAYFILKVNGSEVTIQYYAVYPSAYSNASICNFMVDLNAGTHNIDFYVHHIDGVAHKILPKYSSIIILPVD